MSWSQTDLDNIDTAIANGVMTVDINGTKITYRTLAELNQVRSQIINSLSATATNGFSFQTAKHSKGFC